MKKQSVVALSLLGQGLSLKQVAKKLGVKHGWLLAHVDSFVPMFQFGVELETRYSGQDLPLKTVEMFYEVGYHRIPDGYDIFNQKHWRQTWDGSINCHGEYVSPILKGRAGVDSLREVCKALKSKQAIVDNKCGLHVHIDRAFFNNKEHIKRFISLYSFLEEQIDLMMPSDRRGNRNEYCRTLTNGHDPFYDRYGKINCCNSATVEIRHHSGTIDFHVIMNWIHLLQQLVIASRKDETFKGKLESYLISKTNQFYKERTKQCV